MAMISPPPKAFFRIVGVAAAGLPIARTWPESSPTKQRSADGQSTLRRFAPVRIVWLVHVAGAAAGSLETNMRPLLSAATPNEPLGRESAVSGAREPTCGTPPGEGAVGSSEPPPSGAAPPAKNPGGGHNTPLPPVPA